MEHHIYIDAVTGRWGDRSSLVIVAVTDDELERLQALSDGERVQGWGEATRYFGDVPVARGPVRRHLSIRDQAGTDAPPPH